LAVISSREQQEQAWEKQCLVGFRHTVPLCANLVLAALLSGLPAHAADLSDRDDPLNVQTRIETAWEISISPFYGWVPGFNGKMAVFGQPPVNIDITPTDIMQNINEFLDVLEGVYIGNGQVRHGKFGFMWDVVHFEVRAVDQIGGDFIGGPLDVGFSTTKAALAATYRAHETDKSHLDILVGARITDVDLNVGVDLGFLGGFSGSDGDTWVDPLVGVRGRANLTERVYIHGWAMIGGFGVESDFLWDVAGVVGYDIKDWLSAYAGYRGSYTDFQNGDFIWDVTMYGPIIGFELTF
jgi:hypothetical protein